jgi:hypothetical protein
MTSSFTEAGNGGLAARSPLTPSGARFDPGLRGPPGGAAAGSTH